MSRMRASKRLAGALTNGFYRFLNTAQNLASFTHANTADRTYTLPDSTGTISVGAHGPASVQVLTSTGTWTRPSGIVNVRMKVVGGGGGGGGGILQRVGGARRDRSAPVEASPDSGSQPIRRRKASKPSSKAARASANRELLRRKFGR